MGRSSRLLAIASVLTIGAMMWCAAHGNKYTINVVALLFTLAAIWTAWTSRMTGRTADIADSSRDWPAAIAQIKTTTTISAAVYAWGGVAMLLIYQLSGLRWQHGWQYGSIMLLIAAGLFAFVKAIDAPSSRLRAPTVINRTVTLAALHGSAAAVALVWLVLSGKLVTSKGDWAANAIFVAGGLAIIGVCAITAQVHRNLTNS